MPQSIANTVGSGSSEVGRNRPFPDVRCRLMIVSGSVIIGLLIAEVTLRCLSPPETPVRRLDSGIGIAYQPGIRFKQTMEGCSEVRINSFGFHDEDWSVTKPSGTVRIAILGDSFVDAVEVSEKKRFSELLQKKLNTTPDRRAKFEVMNFGLRNHGTAQELLVFRHHAVRFSPDIVVLTVFAPNDVRNNSIKLQRDPGRPYFYSNAEGHLTLDNSFLDRSTATWRTLGRRIKQCSRIAKAASEAVAVLMSYQHPPSEKGLDNSVFGPPSTQDWIDAWKLTENIIRQLHIDVRKSDARLVVMTATQGKQVSPNASDRQTLLDGVSGGNIFYPENRLREFCRSEGIDVLTLAPIFAGIAESNGTFFHGFENTSSGTGHWNEKGHACAAHHLYLTVKRVVSKLDGSENKSQSTRPESVP